MKHEPAAHHIETIFQALQVGMEGVLEDSGNNFQEADFTAPDLPLDMPPTQSYAHVRIDGHEYKVTVEPMS